MSAYTVDELRRRQVPESYIEEFAKGVRDHIKERENKVCPDCGSPVKLDVWPDFICEKGHKSNVNFLKERTKHPFEEVIERYLPKVGPEEEEEKPREQVRLTPENVEWAIDAALTHYAEDWIRRNVRELLKARKRDEALKFLREHCRNFGVASPGKPYVHGTEKGILIDSAIIDPEESKLITWVELLKHVEIGEVKKLEEF